MELNKQIALIAGGASGLGVATANHLVSHGAKVVVLDRDEASIRKINAESEITAFACDVTNEREVEKILMRVVEEVGEPRICVNCAGVAPAKRIVGKNGPMPLADFANVININLIGTFNVMRVLADRISRLNPVTEDGERGVIINTASVAAFEGQIGQAAYSASKGGVVAMTLPAARECARFGIRVVTIAPGIFATPMLLNMPEEVQDSLGRSVPFPKRLGKPEEYAKLVAHIIENSMLNACVIRLDGAIRMAEK